MKSASKKSELLERVKMKEKVKKKEENCEKETLKH